MLVDLATRRLLGAALAVGAMYALPGTAVAGDLFGNLVSMTPSPALPNPHAQPTAKPTPLPGQALQFCSTVPHAGGSSGLQCYETVTGQDGAFYIPDLPSGQYEVKSMTGNGTGPSGTIFVPQNGDLGISIETK